MTDPNSINYSLNDAGVGSVLDFATSQEQGISDALKQYTMAVRSQKNPLTLYSELESAAGIPGMKTTASTLREQIASLEDSIKRAEGEVSATTGQSLVTEAQRSGMVAAKKKPLTENLTGISTNLGRIENAITAAGSDIGTKVGLYQDYETSQLEPYKTALTVMQDRAARLTSGFSADNENKLSLYLKKVERAEELDDREAEEAFQLMLQENTYNNTINQMLKESEISMNEYNKKKTIDNSSNSSSGYDYYGDSNTSSSISSLWGTLA